MASQIDIVNMALTRLGAPPISALTEDTELADIVEANYFGVLDALLCEHDWSFAKKKLQLARLAVAPVNEWSYAYQLPSDRIGPPLNLYDSTGTGIRPAEDYEVFGGDQVHTDYETVVCEYPFRPDESLLPAMFVQALADRLAHKLALSITDDPGIHSVRLDEAERSLRRAKSRDDRMDAPKRLVSRVLLDARWSG